MILKENLSKIKPMDILSIKDGYLPIPGSLLMQLNTQNAVAYNL